MPCYAAIHRTWDYPVLDEQTYRRIIQYLCPVTQATKIGGVCPWIQGEEDIPGTFLCSLNSISAYVREPFPFLNVPEPISYDEGDKSRPLMIADCGLMYIFVNSYGDLRWWIQGG